MTLTEEEKKKIEEEEQYRAGVRSGISNQPPSSKKKHFSFGRVILVVFTLIVGFFMLIAISDKGGKQSSGVSLNADVKYSSSEVKITNEDSFDWSSCELVLNLSNASYYQMLIDGVPSRRTRTVGLADFVKLGTTERFNPLEEKLGNFSIRCQTPSGKGFWSVGSKP